MTTGASIMHLVNLISMAQTITNRMKTAKGTIKGDVQMGYHVNTNTVVMSVASLAMELTSATSISNVVKEMRIMVMVIVAVTMLRNNLACGYQWVTNTTKL